jgi:hypothetical protein
MVGRSQLAPLLDGDPKKPAQQAAGVGRTELTDRRRDLRRVRHPPSWQPAAVRPPRRAGESPGCAHVDAVPARLFRPPYTGGRGWIAVILDTDPS